MGPLEHTIEKRLAEVRARLMQSNGHLSAQGRSYLAGQIAALDLLMIDVQNIRDAEREEYEDWRKAEQAQPDFSDDDLAY